MCVSIFLYVGESRVAYYSVWPLSSVDVSFSSPLGFGQRTTPCNSSTHLCAILCLKNAFCSKEPVWFNRSAFEVLPRFISVCKCHRYIRWVAFSPTLGAWLLLLHCCLYRGKWITSFFVLLFPWRRADSGTEHVVTNMVASSLLWSCAYKWSCWLYSSVKWRSSLSRQCLCFSPFAEQVLFDQRFTYF